MAFQKARRGQAKLRAALIGVAGSGKTMTALLLAKGLGERIAVVDTENFSASKYADVADFDVQALESFEVERYIKAIHEAEEGGYDVLIIDSLSHAWAGPGGVLDFVDNKKAASRNGDGRDAWRAATPLQNKLVQAMLQSKCHIIATMRAKTEYETQKDERGRVKMVKVGLAPVQRDQLEYEFDLVGTVDETHTVVWSKTRYSPWTDKAMERPGTAAGQELRRWLSDGVAPSPAPKLDPYRIRGGVVHPPGSGAHVPPEAAAEAKAKQDDEKRAALDAGFDKMHELDAKTTGSVSAPRETVAKQAKVAEAKAAVERHLGTAPREPVVVGFGPFKGQDAYSLSVDDLAETIFLADDKLKAEPKAGWANTMRKNLKALEAVAAARAKANNEPGAEG